MEGIEGRSLCTGLLAVLLHESRKALASALACVGGIVQLIPLVGTAPAIQQAIGTRRDGSHDLAALGGCGHVGIDALGALQHAAKIQRGDVRVLLRVHALTVDVRPVAAARLVAPHVEHGLCRAELRVLGDLPLRLVGRVLGVDRITQLHLRRIHLAERRLRELRLGGKRLAGDANRVVRRRTHRAAAQVVALPLQARLVAKRHLQAAITKAQLGVDDHVEVRIVVLLGAFQRSTARRHVQPQMAAVHGIAALVVVHMPVQIGGDGTRAAAIVFQLRNEITGRHHLALTPFFAQARMVVEQHDIRLLVLLGLRHERGEPVQLLLHVVGAKQAAPAVIVVPVAGVVHGGRGSEIAADDAQAQIVERVPVQRMLRGPVRRHAVEILAIGLRPALFSAGAGLLQKVLVIARCGNQGHVGRKRLQRAKEIRHPTAARAARAHQIAWHHEAGQRLRALGGSRLAIVLDHALHDVFQSIVLHILGIGHDGEFRTLDPIRFTRPGLELVRTGHLRRGAGAGHHRIFIKRVGLERLHIGKEYARIAEITHRIRGLNDGERRGATGLAHPDGGRLLRGLQHHRHVIGPGVLQRGADAQRRFLVRLRQCRRVERRRRHGLVLIERNIVQRPVPVVAGAAVVPAQLRRGRACGNRKGPFKGLVQRIGRDRKTDRRPLVKRHQHIRRLRTLALAVMRVEVEHITLARQHVDSRRNQRRAIDLLRPQAIGFDDGHAIQAQSKIAALGRGIRRFLREPRALVQKLPAQPFGRPLRQLHGIRRAIGIKGLNRPTAGASRCDLAGSRERFKFLTQHILRKGTGANNQRNGCAEQPYLKSIHELGKSRGSKCRYRKHPIRRKPRSYRATMKPM